MPKGYLLLQYPSLSLCFLFLFRGKKREIERCFSAPTFFFLPRCIFCLPPQAAAHFYPFSLAATKKKKETAEQKKLGAAARRSTQKWGKNPLTHSHLPEIERSLSNTYYYRRPLRARREKQAAATQRCQLGGSGHRRAGTRAQDG